MSLSRRELFAGLAAIALPVPKPPLSLQKVFDQIPRFIKKDTAVELSWTSAIIYNEKTGEILKVIDR